MRLAFFGSGYVGLVRGVCFADLGNEVICADVDKEKIAAREGSWWGLVIIDIAKSGKPVNLGGSPGPG